MNLLFICETSEGLPVPAFRGELEAHLAKKRHPGAHAASLTAWNLLAHGLKLMGLDELPAVRFEPGGRPYFESCPLHFSISHSANMAAVLISPDRCAVDIEAVRPQVQDKLAVRCLSEEERRLELDFFDCWTKKECLGKLSGRGLPAHPAKISSISDEHKPHFFLHRLKDSAGQEYALAALCTNGQAPKIEKIVPERLF